RPRSGERPNGNTVAFQAYHDLGRAAHQAQRPGLEIKHERAGIDDPQSPVDVKRAGLGLRLQALTENHLKNVARADVFLTALHSSLEGRRLEVGSVRQMHFADGTDIGQLEVGHPLLETLDEAIDASAGRLI